VCVSVDGRWKGCGNGCSNEEGNMSDEMWSEIMSIMEINKLLNN
jgi:hypothetical protein